MTHSPQLPRDSNSAVAWMFVLYVLFVVYGSLVPLQYVDRSLGDAVQAFKSIPFLTLGVASRADWVANGVLYVPVGFLTVALLLQSYPRLPRGLLFVVAAAFSMGLAFAVEFTQLFFPSRTVSLNDLIAECIGSLTGVALAARFTVWIRLLFASFFGDPERLKKLALEGYAVAYIAFSLFPYDVLLSGIEVQAKIDSDSWGWWLAGNSARPMLLGLQLLAEAILTLPFGVLLARLSARRSSVYVKAALMGVALGILIEIAQFFIASGVSQGLSVLTRALGLGCGLALANHSARWTADSISAYLRRYTLPLLAAYVLAMFEINSWNTTNWQGLHVAQGQLAQLSLIPFYYHYYTTEAKALFSLAAVSLSYVPIGVLVWAHRRSPGFALVVSLGLATCIELGKLFLPPSHPDLTNLLLACAASWFTVTLLRQVMTPKVAGEPVVASEVRQSTAPLSTFTLPIWLILSLLVAGVWVFSFPAFPWAVGLVLTASAVAVWFRPILAFVIIPAALPVFDFAPWSGRFYFDEFDALFLVTLAVAFARAPALPHSRWRLDVLFTSLAGLLAFSFVISAVLGLLPFQLPDANSFNNYHSPYNALRIFKGAAWAYLAYTLARRFESKAIDVRRSFAWGMVAGLGLTVVVIVWERVTFSGLFNFSEGYRVTGPFSAIHIGGAYIECFLAAATPFLMLLMLEKRHWFVRLAGLLLLLATTYALMVTFSRNGYVAFAVAVGISLLAALLKTKRLFRSSFVLAALAGSLLLVAVPIFKGEFSQARMATVRADLDVRQVHWDDALAIRDTGWATSLFGMGLGRYPYANFWRSAEGNRSATYHFAATNGNTYLRLGSGDSLYVEQLVNVEPKQAYVLKLEARASVPDARITVPICERWMLTSYNCIWHSLALGKEFGEWRKLEVKFTANELSISPWHSQRPIKLALYYGASNSTIDIDSVRLETAQGENLVKNGDFAKGLDHWFFSTGGHLQWHIKSMFYGVLFDQGWLGVVALVGLLILALSRAGKSAYHGDPLSGAGLAALTSFLVVGVFDTLIDAPRFLLLLLLLTWFCSFHMAAQMAKPLK